MARSTLSCCFVVKNEEQQIAQALDCITVLADEIIIVDTGSTDGTLSVVNSWTRKYNAQNAVKVFSVGNQFHDTDGDFDFGGAKTHAIRQATKDFVMWLDATDRVTNQRDVKKQFIDITNKNKNVYIAMPTALSDNFAFIRTRIGPRVQSSMVGRIHEYMAFTNATELTRHFIGSSITNHKEQRNLSRNIRQLLKEWAIRPTARICFYIALTYREMHDIKNALEWFRRRVYTHSFKNEFDEEYFKSIECIAEIIVDQIRGPQADLELYDMATQMIEHNTQRVEGHYYMGRYYMRKEEYEKAQEYLRKYRGCKKPKTYKLWLNGAIYNGKAILNALEDCKTAMKYKDVLKPDEILDLHPPTRSTFTRGDGQYY